MKRRKVLQKLAIYGASASLPSLFSFDMKDMMKRKIGRGNETIPVVGLGTWQTFDVGADQAERKQLQEVLKNLIAAGASVIDSSPMYGSSEEVVGELSTELNINKNLFIATKVWTTGRDAGIKQMNNSLQVLKRSTIDLMQIHNLVDWQVHLKTLRDWKEAGKIRYIGLTHYADSSHETLRNIISNNQVDFIQINYSIDSRNAERTLLPAALDKGVAVLINRPFNEGALFRKVKGKQLPEWTKEFDCDNWASFFLKYILANPAVTCVIPGTSNPRHLADNLSAGVGRLPTSDHLKKMISIMS